MSIPPHLPDVFLSRRAELKMFSTVTRQVIKFPRRMHMNAVQDGFAEALELPARMVGVFGAMSAAMASGRLFTSWVVGF